MRCDEVLDIIFESGGKEFPADVREHLRACVACETAARDWQTLRLGFRACATEPVPDPSLGFARRLTRRLGETEPERGAFFERVGRRFVYAALLLAFTLFLALVLPATGPVRAPANAEIYLAQPEAVEAQNDTIFPGQSVEDVSYHPQSGSAGVPGGMGLEMTRRVYLYFAVTFVLGVVLGGVGMFLYAWYGGHWPRPFSKERLVNQITRDLALEPGQKQQLTAIIDDSSKKYDALHAEVHPRFVALRDATDDRIRAILTPEQLVKFNALVQAWRKQHP